MKTLARKRTGCALLLVLALTAGLAFVHHPQAAHAQTATFADGFQDGVDDGWTRETGSWRVATDGAGNDLVYEQTATGNGIAAHNTITGREWGPFHLALQVEPADLTSAEDGVRVLFRYQNLDNHYVLFLTSSSVQLRRRVDGILTTIEQSLVPIGNGTRHWIDIEGRGNHFTVHVDRARMFSVYDGTFSVGGIGLGTWQTAARFDNVRITGTAGGAGLVRLGVAQSNLEDWFNRDTTAQHEILEAIDAAGINRIRLGYARPNQSEVVRDQICYADGLGLQVSLVIGLSGNKFYYPPDTARADRANFPDVFRLSDLDPDRFKAHLRAFLEMIKSSECSISSLLIANEPNWIGFNGDLPEVSGGRVYDNDAAETLWDTPGFQRILDGVDKWGQAIGSATEVADAVFGPNVVKIVTGGFADIPNGHVERSGGSYLKPDLLLQLLQGTHDFQIGAPDHIASADFIGTHIYPYQPYDTNPASGYTSIRDHLLGVMGPVVSKIGTSKTFWIGEVGFRDGSITEEQQLRLMRWFVLALYDRQFFAMNWTNVFVYNYIDNPALSLYQDNRLRDAALIFRDYPY